MNRYSIVDLLSRGTFGRVLVVQSKASRRRYVMKEVLLGRMNARERERALTEVAILSRLRHPHIIRYKEAFLDLGALLIVMEYADAGDLKEYLRRHHGTLPLPQERIIEWASQLAVAVAYIHSQGILHRDIKTQNIFLMHDRSLKLGDFGIAREMTQTMEWATTMVGTPYYLSPELCENKPYNRQSDMWALGCVLYELCTYRHPFEGATVHSLMRSICLGTFSPIPPCYGPPLPRMISSLLSVDPQLRPTAQQLLSMLLPGQPNHQNADGDSEGPSDPHSMNFHPPQPPNAATAHAQTPASGARIHRQSPSSHENYHSAPPPTHQRSNIPRGLSQEPPPSQYSARGHDNMGGYNLGGEEVRHVRQESLYRTPSRQSYRSDYQEHMQYTPSHQSYAHETPPQSTYSQHRSSPRPGETPGAGKDFSLPPSIAKRPTSIQSQAFLDVPIPSRFSQTRLQVDQSSTSATNMQMQSVPTAPPDAGEVQRRVNTTENRAEGGQVAVNDVIGTDNDVQWMQQKMAEVSISQEGAETHLDQPINEEHYEARSQSDTAAETIAVANDQSTPADRSTANTDTTGLGRLEQYLEETLGRDTYHRARLFVTSLGDLSASQDRAMASAIEQVLVGILGTEHMRYAPLLVQLARQQQESSSQ